MWQQCENRSIAAVDRLPFTPAVAIRLRLGRAFRDSW